MSVFNYSNPFLAADLQPVALPMGISPVGFANLMTQPAAAMMAGQAIGLGAMGQVYGAMFGVMSGAMSAASKLSKDEFDLPRIPAKVPDIYGFEWSFGLPTGESAARAPKDIAKTAVEKSRPSQSAPAVTAKLAATKATPVKAAPAPANPVVAPKAAVAARPSQAPAQAMPARAANAAAPAAKASASPEAAPAAVANKGLATASTAKAPKPESKPAADMPVAANDQSAAKAVEIAPEDFKKPSVVSKPAQPDDLKLISGVGPKLEASLNEIGIWTFAQIAKWTDAEIAWVDDFLNFKGRITRDNWIAQADALATGGADEYQKRFGKDPR